MPILHACVVTTTASFSLSGIHWTPRDRLTFRYWTHNKLFNSIVVCIVLNGYTTRVIYVYSI